MSDEVVKKKRGRPRKVKKEVKAEIKEEPKEKRPYIENVVVNNEGAKCPHCSNRYDHIKKNKYPNGNQRVLCGSCKMPFVIRKIMT